jgi:hypothetical protein
MELPACSRIEDICSQIENYECRAFLKATINIYLYIRVIYIPLQQGGQPLVKAYIGHAQVKN